MTGRGEIPRRIKKKRMGFKGLSMRELLIVCLGLPLAQFGQDLARSPDAEVIRDAVGIVTLFGQCMLRRKAGLQNLHNSVNDLFERGGLQSTNGDYRALRPKSRRPKQITFRVPDTVVGIIFTLRHQLGWGGHRIAAELKTCGIAKVSGRTVYKIFDRLGLPVKIYALKGKTGVSAKALAKPFGRTVVSFQNRSAAASVKDCRTSWRRFFSRMSSISFKSVDSH